jgi:cell division protein FtsL
MTRINFMLLAILALCATGLVTSQHKARKLFTQLEKEQERSRQLDVEWGQLQLEQSTWAMHGRVERVARQVLHMGVPDPRRTQIVQPDGSTAPLKPDEAAAMDDQDAKTPEAKTRETKTPSTKGAGVKP